MSNKNDVFEYLIDQLRQQVNNNPCEDLAHEVQSLKNQLRDASALVAELQKDNIKKSEHISHLTGQVKELHMALATATGDVEAYKLIRKQEQSGCRKEDIQVAEPWVKWEGGECPVPKDTIVQIRMRDGTSACEPRVAGELRWDHRGWRGDITRYRVVKPECKHDWVMADADDFQTCSKCGALA